jgi:hypothetical protein
MLSERVEQSLKATLFFSQSGEPADVNSHTMEISNKISRKSRDIGTVLINGFDARMLANTSVEEYRYLHIHRTKMAQVMKRSLKPNQ